MSPSASPSPASHAVASAWVWGLLPFVMAGVWTPLARASGVYEGTAAVPLIFASAALGLLALLGAWRSLAAGLAIAGVGSVVVAALTATTGAGIGVAAGCLLTCASAAVLGARELAARLPDLSAFASARPRLIAWAVALAVLGFGQAARIAAHIADPSFTLGALVPNDPMMAHHACLTAYVHGSILADQGLNIYESFGADGTTAVPLPPTAAHFAPFALDAYGYPPPFLLVPKLLRLISEDFISMRAMFAALGIGTAFAAMAALAAQLPGETSRRLWIGAPVGLLTPISLAAANISNFHLMMVALCVLAWVAFERARLAAGGGLLGFAILAKISPGLLGIHLLARRRWAEAAATAAAAAVIVALSWPASGTHTWLDFFRYHLPQLSSGEALGFLAEPSNAIFNLAPFGIPFKLGALGLEGWGWDQAGAFSTVYTLVLVVVAVVAGVRGGPPSHRAIVWLSLVFLASLRSPYAPTYVACSFVFALLVLAGELRTRAQVAVYALAWLPLCTPMPKDAFGLSLLLQLALIGAALGLALRRPPASGRAEQLVDGG